MERIQPLKDRARVVCVACHARKVKCDLQNRPDEVCTNCSRGRQTCVRRNGVRTRQKPTRQRPAQSVVSAFGSPADNADLSILPHHADSSSVASINRSPPVITQLPQGFISPSTVMCHDPQAEDIDTSATYPQSQDLRASILTLTEADVLPRPTLLRALADAYFQHVHPYYPIVEESDLTGPDAPVLLQQAVCLAGSMMQHNSDMIHFCKTQYEKVKTLIYLNYEHDNVVILKTMCLLTCHSVITTDKVTLDGPWQWLGMAARLAFQMGLHKNVTYQQYSDPRCIRRIFWLLTNSDRLATACWGRPSALLHVEHDIPPLTEQDFSTQGRCPMLFLQTLRLSAILEAITRVNVGGEQLTSALTDKLVDDLCEWIGSQPEELHLFSPDKTRRTYWRPAVELHIWYFVNIILLQLLDSARFPWKITTSSFVAASCVARLYEEIDCHEDTPRLLQFHGFFCMAAAVPLILYPCGLQDASQNREEEIDIVCRVLEKIRRRYGGSGLVLTKIRRLRANTRLEIGCSADGSSNGTERPSMLAASSIRSRVYNLFPFTQDLSSSLDLLVDDPDHMNCTGESLSAVAERGSTAFSSEDHFDLASMLFMDFPFHDVEGSNDGVWSEL